MTHSPAYSTGLTADSTDLTTTDGRILMRVVEGRAEVWEVRGRDTVIPGAHGQVPRNRKRNRLVIIAEGMVMGEGDTEAEQRADFTLLQATIRTLMDPTQDPYELVDTLEDGSTATITARPVNVAWGDDDLPSYRTLSCEWLAIGDDWLVEGS